MEVRQSGTQALDDAPRIGERYMTRCIQLDHVAQESSLDEFHRQEGDVPDLIQLVDLDDGLMAKRLCTMESSAQLLQAPGTARPAHLNDFYRDATLRCIALKAVRGLEYGCAQSALEEVAFLQQGANIDRRRG